MRRAERRPGKAPPCRRWNDCETRGLAVSKLTRWPTSMLRQCSDVASEYEAISIRLVDLAMAQNGTLDVDPNAIARGRQVKAE